MRRRRRRGIQYGEGTRCHEDSLCDPTNYGDVETFTMTDTNLGESFEGKCEIMEPVYRTEETLEGTKGSV